MFQVGNITIKNRVVLAPMTGVSNGGFSADGTKAVALHGRTREQMYEEHADWDIIREVKQSVNILVIGNGTVRRKCKDLLKGVER